MMITTINKLTYSLCPHCLKVVEASVFEEGGAVKIEKNVKSMVCSAIYTGLTANSTESSADTGIVATGLTTPTPAWIVAVPSTAESVQTTRPVHCWEISI